MEVGFLVVDIECQYYLRWHETLNPVRNMDLSSLTI